MGITAGADGTARNLNGVGVTYFIANASKVTQSWLVSAWQDIGFTIVRVQNPWNKIVPNLTAWQAGPSAWTWTALDSCIQQCNAAGIKVIVGVQFAPSFLLVAPYGVQCSVSPSQYQASPADVATFAGAVAARYNGGANGFADCIELMNEDYSLSSNQPSCNGGALYAPVLKAGYNAIKAQQPLICVGCAAQLGQMYTPIVAWYQPLFTAGCGSILEQGYANYHFYKGQNTQHPWDIKTVDVNVNFESDAQTLNNVARQNGFNHVPVACTEIGWAINTNFGRSTSSVFTQAQQSEYFLYELEAMRRAPYVQFVCLYTLSDTSDGMSLVQGAGPPPAVSYNQAYFDIKAWIASNSDWIGKPDGTIAVHGRDGIVNIVTP